MGKTVLKQCPQKCIFARCVVGTGKETHTYRDYFENLGTDESIILKWI
jgi:hypothetical protein